MRTRVFLVLIALLCSASVDVHGDVITSYSVNSPIVQGANGGVADVTINIRSTAAEAYGAYVSGFRIVDGSNNPVPNTIAPSFVSVNAFGTGATVTSFGVEPFFSSGNVDAGSYFRLLNSSEVELSLITQSGGVLIPPIDVPLARFQINTNLTPGIYTILAIPQDVQSATGISLPFSFSAASFTVEAVPEPSSWLLIGFACSAILCTRRRKDFFRSGL